jgi:hypothetical protein
MRIKDPGVIEENIQPAEHPHRFANGALALLGGAHISPNENGCSPRPPYFFDNLLSARSISPRDRDFGPFARKKEGRGAADP